MQLPKTLDNHVYLYCTVGIITQSLIASASLERLVEERKYGKPVLPSYCIEVVVLIVLLL